MQGDHRNSSEFGGEWEMLSYAQLCSVSSDQEQSWSCSCPVQEGRARRQKSNANLTCLIEGLVCWSVICKPVTDS